MKEHKQFAINLIASLVNFLVNIGIGFVLTPYITENVGAEAYGFVGLANNMVNYASLFTIALNSVVGRFVTVAYHQGDKEKADRYFSSTLWADALMVLGLTVVAIPLILNLENVLRISPRLVTDVKWLFLFVFLNFATTTLATILNVATFIKNKLYLSSLANIAYSLVRVLVMVICYLLFPTYVLFVGLATCAGSVAMALLNYVFTVRLTPELKFRRRDISWKATKELLASGIWNAVVKLQQILQDGLSLLIANLVVSPHDMGLLSIAQVVPTGLSSLTGTISNLFSPLQTKYFAQHRKKEMLDQIKAGMRIAGIFTNVILVILLIDGFDFIRLWQPHQDHTEIYWLMMATLADFSVSGVATTLQGIPLLVNHLRGYSIAWLASGAISLLVTLMSVWMTPWGIYAIALVPRLLEIIMNVTFVPIYAANCIEVPVRSFYWIYVQDLFATLVASAVSFAAFLPLGHAHSWAKLILECIVTGILTLVTDFFLLIGKNERTLLRNRLLRKKHS